MANLYPDTILNVSGKISTVGQLQGRGFSGSAIKELVESGAATIVAEGSSASGAAVGSVADHLAQSTSGRSEPSPGSTARPGM